MVQIISNNQKDSYYTGEHVDNKIWEAYKRVTTKTEINV